MKIDEAVEVLEQDMFSVYCTDLKEAMGIAVNSLKAWESVKQEIKSNCIFVTYVVKDRTAEGIAKIIDDVLKQTKEQFLDIIDNHLEELEGKNEC